MGVVQEKNGPALTGGAVGLPRMLGRGYGARPAVPVLMVSIRGRLS